MNAVLEQFPEAAAPPKLTVRDLNFYYGGFHALRSINLEVPANRVTAFIGPSGCGKSTLLRTFNRMFELYPEQRAEGEILMDGENILKSKMVKRGLDLKVLDPKPVNVNRPGHFSRTSTRRRSRTECCRRSMRRSAKPCKGTARKATRGPG